jgi:hypothetical protein
VAHHEGDLLRCRLAGGDDQVAFVLAVVIVDHDDHLALGNRPNRVFDGVQRHVGLRRPAASGQLPVDQKVAQQHAAMGADLAVRQLAGFQELHQMRPGYFQQVGRLLGGELVRQRIAGNGIDGVHCS